MEAVHGMLVALARVSPRLMVRAVPEDGGVLVTILGAATPAGPLDTEAVGHARSLLRAAGGELVLEPLPYAELRVPGAAASS
ncbi:hypothetical protein [Dactylosporangium sp. NPDC048998]|uniref:hypothetical protein n=1 Tax=Dactylosporangium sp. NPDC048998 TaxID=3363976 RepID=UPI003720AC10